MKVVILAGGLGTRLRERVPDLPKPMAPVAGRPFLAWLLEALSRGGIEDVTLSVGYRWDSIRDHFGHRYGELSLRYAVEPEPLGTGGAVAFACASAGAGAGEAVLVLNGDTYLAIDYAALIATCAHSADRTCMVLRHVDDTARFGRVEVAEGHVVGFSEKGQAGPGLINAGNYVIDAGLFAELGLNGRFSMETDVLQRHCATLKPRAFTTNAWFIDIGIPEDFDRAQRELPKALA